MTLAMMELMRRRKDEQAAFEGKASVPAELVGNEDGDPLDFDDKREVPPLQVVRVGLSIMANEMERLVRKSKRTGLNGMQAAMLTNYTKAASDIAKKHKNLEISFLSSAELEMESDERLDEIIRAALSTIPPEQGSFRRLRKFKPIERPWRAIKHDEN